jgi:hypothetical protein
MGIAFRVILSAGIVVAGASGCGGGGTIFGPRVDTADSCGKEHADFVDSKSFYIEQIGQGVLLGAVGGAAIGALTAAATGGNAGKGALIGGAVGGVAGGAAGYFNARQKEATDSASLSRTVNGDVTRATVEIDRATTTFGLLRACRFVAADRIKADFTAGKLSHDQAAAALASEKQRFDDELKLAREIGTKMADENQQFRFASDSLVKDDPAAKKELAARQAALAYTATARVKVRAAPAADAKLLDTLAKGQHVQVAGGDQPAEWRQVTLTSDKSGYVPAKYLAPPGAKPPPSDNPNVQVAVAATESIPQKRAAYGKSVDDAAAQSNISFNLDNGTG